jgi:protein-S-isoprenylcysteine O-methyltransferase Ste14
MTIMTTGVFILSGRWADPWLWTYLALWGALSLRALMGIDENLAQERFHPPTTGADRIALCAVRLTAMAHLVAGALDVGRWHATDTVPTTVRGLAMLGMAVGALLVFRAMRENYFFSSVVRIQTERGHRLVDTGPYAVIRHPGYAGMIVAIPLSGLALGSWMSFGFALVYAGLILRRVVFEDMFLRRQLAGYEDYTTRVRSRLIPAVW